MSALISLAGRHALITGGSRGIGRATALLFGRLGARVCVNYARDEKAAEEVVAAIQAAGGEAFALRADVSDPKQAQLLVEGAMSRLGDLDAVVVNHGIWKRASIDDDDAGAVGRDRAHQPGRHVQRLPSCGAADDPEAARGDRPDRLDLGPAGRGPLLPLLRHQRRALVVHEVARLGAGASRHPRQRCRAGLGADRHDARRTSKAPVARRRSRRFRSAAPERPKRSRGPWPSSCPTSRPTCTARS